MPLLTALRGPGSLRAALALLVVLSHMSSVRLGRPAVFVFFALSGYWVVRMYVEKYRRAGSVWPFYASRFLRIWPSFATAVVMAYLAFAWLAAPKDAVFLWGLTLVGIATTKLDVLGTAWSLDLELQFYAAVPLMVLTALWLGRLPQAAAGLTLAIATALLTAAAWWLRARTGISLFLCYLPCFVAGALMFGLRMRASRPRAMVGLGLFLGSAVLFAVLPQTRFLVIRSDLSTWWEDGFGMIWTMLLIPYLAWNVRQPSGWLDQHLGNWSFALYIVHVPVIAIMGERLAPPDKGLVLGMVIVTSVAFYILVDQGWQRLRKRAIAGRAIAA